MSKKEGLIVVRLVAGPPMPRVAHRYILYIVRLYRESRSIMSHTPMKPPVFLILLALTERERHGYALARVVGELSGGTVRLATGPLYRHLKDLLDLGWIEETEPVDRPSEDDARRRYYRLSDRGREVLVTETERLRELVAMSGRLLASRR
jgi:PadR family transcriptional regulator